jgi:hypothetical protein
MLVGAVMVQLCELHTKLEPEITMVSTRTPAAPAATALLSVAARHLNLIGWPAAAAGKLIVDVM